MRIYVGNLPYTYDDQELASLFKSYGEVSSARIVLDRESGRSRGFGFIEMPDENAARTAMSGMDGHRIDGRPLQVNEARPSAAHTGGGPPRRDRDGGGGPPGGGFSSGPRPPRGDRSGGGFSSPQGGNKRPPSRSHESERKPSRGRDSGDSSGGDGWGGGRGGRRRGGENTDWDE